MRRPDTTTVINMRVVVVVTTRTRRQRRRFRVKLFTLMLRVAVCATNPSRNVWLDHRRLKRLRVVTTSTTLVHVAL